MLSPNSYDRTEVALDRVHWTYADYLDEGRRQWDERADDPQRRGQTPSDRERFARAFAEVSIPPAKRDAMRAAAMAATYAEFGAPPCRRGPYGLELVSEEARHA
jgi:hypothetical protein